MIINIYNTDPSLSIPFISIILSINCIHIAYSHHQVYILTNFVSLLILLFTGLIVLDIYLVSFSVAIVYSGAIIAVFLFVTMILDQAYIHITDNYRFIPLLLLVTQAFLFSFLWPLINQFEITLKENNKISKLDIDTSFSDFTFTDLHNVYHGGALDMFNININVSNPISNENGMQVIANILYNDMNALLLIVGFTLFISLINIVIIFYS